MFRIYSQTCTRLNIMVRNWSGAAMHCATVKIQIVVLHDSCRKTRVLVDFTHRIDGITTSCMSRRRRRAEGGKRKLHIKSSCVLLTNFEDTFNQTCTEIWSPIY